MSVAARRVRMAKRGFSPLSIPWATAFWASGPDFLALGASDGSTLQTWPDEVASLDATNAASIRWPTYRASVAALNNRPALEFITDDTLATASFTSLGQPNTVAVIAKAASTSGSPDIVDGSASARHQIGVRSGSWEAFAGSVLSGGTADTSGHLFIATYNGGSSSLQVDGSTSSGAAGAQAIDRIALGGDIAGTEFFNGHIGFYGLIHRALTTQEKADMRAFAQSFYGTP